MADEPMKPVRRYAGDDWIFNFRSSARGANPDDPNVPNNLTGFLPGAEFIDPQNTVSIYTQPEWVTVFDQDDPQTQGRFQIRLPREETTKYLQRSTANQTPNATFNSRRIIKMRVFFDREGEDRQTQDVLLIECVRA